MMIIPTSRTSWSLLCFCLFAAASTYAAPSQDTGAGEFCSSAKARHLDKQANLRAAFANAACQSSAEFSTKGLVGGSDLNLITGDETFPVVTQAGSMVWANGDEIVAVYTDTLDAPTSFSGVSVSDNGGVTFDRLSPDPFTAVFDGDFGSPTVAYDDMAGEWLIAALVASCGGQGIGLMTTTTPADPESWSIETCPHMGIADDRPILWVDNNASSPFYGRRYLAFNDFDADGTLKVLWFDTGSGMWQEVVVDAATMTDFRRNVHLTGSTGVDGTVFIFGMDEGGGGDNARTNWVFRSTNGGVSWSGVQPGPSYPPVGAGLCAGSNYFYMVPPNWRHMGWGQGAVGPNSVVHYVYARESQTPEDIGDIFYIRSADNGVSWSSPIHLNTDQDNKNNVVQWLPSISVTRQGLVLATWYDRRNTTDGLNYQYFGRLSLDNGLTWEPDAPISDVIIDQPTQFDPMKEFCFAGESNFHTSQSNDALTTWTDGRVKVMDDDMEERSQMDVFFQRVPLCPDIGVSPGVLPNGEVAVGYMETLSGTGGTGPYTFELSGLLPDGLMLDTMTGEIMGTPSATGISFFSVIATDSFGCEGSEDFGLIVDPDPAGLTCPVITLDPTTLLDGAQGEPEMQMVTASGGTEPYSYVVTEGALPEGVTLDSETGEITGVPQESSTFSFSITATDADGCTGTQDYMTNVACPMITLSPSDQLDDAAAGFPYLTVITANGGTAPYKFFPQSATPKGIFYAEGGTIFGVAESGGSKNTNIAVRDVNGCLGEASIRLDSRNCPPGAIFCDGRIDQTGDPLADPVVEPNFAAMDVCGDSEAEWEETQTCSSSDDIGHTPSAHGRWGVPDDCTNYGTNASQGVLESLEFDVSNCNSGEVRLNFNYLIGFEDDATTDRFRVEVIADGGMPEVVADNGPGGPTCGGMESPGLSNLNLWSGWQHVEVIHPATSTFSVNFVAETDDGMNNTGEGVLLDDVVLLCKCPDDFIMMPDVLPNAVLDEAYSETITTEGGQEPVTFGTPPGNNPPPGLQLDPESGDLFGVPTTSGIFTFRAEATDDNACQIFTIYNLIVGPADCPDITFMPDSLDDGVQDTFYSASPMADGGTEPYTFEITAGTLPPGLSLNTSTGTISGTPTSPEVYPFTIGVIDDTLCTGSQDYSIVISPIGCPTISLTPTVLPNPDVGLEYMETLVADGGVAPYEYSVTSGTLPLGLSLDPETGEITGTPTSGGAFSFEITAQDANLCSSTQSFTLDVFGCPGINLLPEELTSGTIDVAYDQTISAEGGTEPYSFSVGSGTLPAGLSLDPDTGALSGTPTESGSFDVSLAATDADGCAGVRSYVLNIGTPMCPIISLAPSQVNNQPVVDAAYSLQLVASGGATPYVFAVTGGALPDGLMVDGGTGEIAGTPTTPGIFNVDVTATDANSCEGMRSYVFLVSSAMCPTITISPESLPSGLQDSLYSEFVTASGGTGPYTYTVIRGSLPDGLSLDSATGEISGTPTQGGTFTFEIAAGDANGCFGSQSHTLSITSSGLEVIFKDSFEEPGFGL